MAELRKARHWSGDAWTEIGAETPSIGGMASLDKFMDCKQITQDLVLQKVA